MSTASNLPRTTDQWVIASKDSKFDGSFSSLKFEKGVPLNADISPNDVLVKIKAVSLNYRDLIIPCGLYPFPLSDKPVVACSDAAAEVVAVGSKVTRFQPGDKVATLFNQEHYYGALDEKSAASGLGGVYDGTLRQYGVFSEHGLVKLPDNLTWEEGGTLTCAGVTAWNALYGLRPLKPGQWVLTQGTGGVSTFALKFAKAAGAKVVATTSSDEKAKALKEMGADFVINYKTTPNWGEEARKLTPKGQGFEHIIEVGGPPTFRQSMAAVSYDGVINVIGMVGGFTAEDQPGILDALAKVAICRGVYVGSRDQMEEMCKAIEGANIKPVVDNNVFPLEKAPDAYRYQFEKKHIGNVVIRVD